MKIDDYAIMFLAPKDTRYRGSLIPLASVEDYISKMQKSSTRTASHYKYYLYYRGSYIGFFKATTPLYDVIDEWEASMLGKVYTTLRRSELHEVILNHVRQQKNC